VQVSFYLARSLSFVCIVERRDAWDTCCFANLHLIYFCFPSVNQRSIITTAQVILYNEWDVIIFTPLIFVNFPPDNRKDISGYFR